MPEFVYFAQKMANLKKLTVRNPAHSYCGEFGKKLPGQILENSPASQTGPS